MNMAVFLIGSTVLFKNIFLISVPNLEKVMLQCLQS